MPLLLPSEPQGSPRPTTTLFPEDRLGIRYHHKA